MLLSVVITVRNRPAYLRYCVEALLKQTNPGPFEIVIVDDASDDKYQTTDMMAELADAQKGSAIPILDLYELQRGGPGKARNRGNAAARGEVIVVQDSDDVSAPNRLAMVRRFFEDSPFDLFWSGAWRCGQDLKVIGRQHAYPSQWQTLEYHQDIWHPTLAYRKRVLEKCAYPNDPADVDYAFLLQAKAQGVKAMCVDEPLVMYRQHPDQISRAQNRLQHELARKNQKKFAPARNAVRLSNYAQNQLKARRAR